jgi:hypothetical protein
MIDIENVVKLNSFRLPRVFVVKQLNARLVRHELFLLSPKWKVLIKPLQRILLVPRLKIVIFIERFLMLVNAYERFYQKMGILHFYELRHV